MEKAKKILHTVVLTRGCTSVLSTSGFSTVSPTLPQSSCYLLLFLVHQKSCTFQRDCKVLHVLCVITASSCSEWVEKRGFIWLIWTPVLSSDWSCSLWNSGSLPGIFLAYVSCFLYRSEWPQFIVSYRRRTYFEIRYHSVSCFSWLVCSTHSHIPFSDG